MQEILPLLLNGGDLTPIHTIPNWDRAPWLEETRLAVVVDQLPSPRALVSHLPYHLMPPSFLASKAKVIGWRHCEIFSYLQCLSLSLLCKYVIKSFERSDIRYLYIRKHGQIFLSHQVHVL